jgi:anti-sigma-K factor RskA
MVAYPRPPEGWTLAVSIEPEGGSPYGTPTGPVILSAVIGADA